MWIAWLNEACCHHFSGVLAVGTKEEMLAFQAANEGNLIDGYYIGISEVDPDLSDYMKEKA